MDVARLALDDIPRLRSIPAPQSGMSSLACIVVNLDRFQSFNNKFGHAAGDALLEVVFGALGRAAPEVRWVWLSKDEFAGFLAADARSAQVAAERLPLDIQSDQGAKLGLSWGLAAQSMDGGELADLVKAAAVQLDQRRQRRR